VVEPHTPYAKTMDKGGISSSKGRVGLMNPKDTKNRLEAQRKNKVGLNKLNKPNLFRHKE